jgi:hypothetical protein
MASSINASTSGAGGVIVTSDASGVLNLQSGGVTVATVQSSGLSLPSGSTFNAANTFGFKNRFINGSMLVNQYTTGTTNIVSSNSFYSLDRWQVRNPASTGGTVTYAQSFDSTTGVTKLRLTYASATSSSYFQQKIEAQNITDLWGNQVTFSLYSNDSAVNVTAYSYDSSGTEATLFSNATPTSLGNNRYSYTFTCTTPAGGIRSGNALGMIIQINVRGGATPANSTNYDYWNCQLELGSQATSFDFRSIGQELALCQRYYQEFGFNGVIGQGQNADRNSGSYVSFPVPLRTTPTTLGKEYDVDIGDITATFTPILYTDKMSQCIGWRPYRNISMTVTRGDTMDILNSGTNLTTLGGGRHPFIAEL